MEQGTPAYLVSQNLNTVQEACDWGGNTPKVFKQSYDIGVTTLQAKAWFKIMPSDA